MKFKTAILAVAAACSLAVASFAATGAQRASQPTPLERAYDTMLDNVRELYIGTQITSSDWDRLQAHYGKKIGSLDELQTALDKTLKAAGDARLKMLTTAEVDQLDAHVRSSFVGIGLYLDPVSFVDGSFLIENVAEDSTAEAAGLKVADRVTAIDGEPIQIRDLNEISSMIMGHPGTKVTFTVIRGGQTMSIPVERDLDRRIGITMKAYSELKAFKIDSVNEKGPAAAAGLKKGDAILSIDGKTTQSMSRDSASDALRYGRPGSKVVVSILRDRQISLVTVTRDFVVNSRFTIDLSGEKPSWKPGFWHFRINHLDWTTMIESIGDLVGMLENDDTAVILDLRSTKGNNPDLAAKVASWFVNSGIVLRHESGTGFNKYTTTYEVTSDAIVKHYSGAKTGSDSIALPEDQKRFTKQLIVLVDSETAGTAEALALALQASGRATVTGATSAAKPTLTTTVRYSFGNGPAVVAQVPSRTLVKTDGGTITGVTPDKSVFFESDIVDTAKYQIDGETWRLHDNTMVYVSVAAAACVIVLLFFVVIRLTESKESDEGAHADAVENDADCGCSDTDTTAKSSDAKAQEEEKPMPRWLKWLTRLTLAGMVVALFSMSYIFDYLNGPPEGYRSEISVIAYVDDSDIGKLQKKAVEQLASEYSGAIKFQIIDASVTPELAVHPKWGPITVFPSISVNKMAYDKDGKETSINSGLASMAYTKRQLIDHIESLAKSQRKFWPNTDIKRVRPATP